MSTNLTGQSIADTYGQLLHIDGGPDATEKTVYSGTGTPTALKLGTGSASVDNIVFNGNTISTSDANGNLLLSPSGTGAVVMTKVNITGGSIVGITDLAIADGGTGASNAASARSNLGLGTMATQDASAVNISGGTIAGVTLTGSFTGMTLVGATTLTGTVVNGGNLRMSGNSIASVDTNGNIQLTPDGTGIVVTGTLLAVGALGYGVGSGSTVTQITSKATGVAINTINGEIVTHNASLADLTTVSFVVTNTRVAATDLPVVCLKSGGAVGGYLVFVGAVAAGSFTVCIRNVSGGPLAEALSLSFAIIKGVMT